jgi:hypothetical protein
VVLLDLYSIYQRSNQTLIYSTNGDLAYSMRIVTGVLASPEGFPRIDLAIRRSRWGTSRFGQCYRYIDFSGLVMPFFEGGCGGAGVPKGCPEPSRFRSRNACCRVEYNYLRDVDVEVAALQDSGSPMGTPRNHTKTYASTENCFTLL